ncbi:uncharacterized protein SAMN04489751_0976 [Brevibacterium sandarakinum]|uniref:Radical SAM core domain-containing protein n=1 Tax=Brevibacterium sandarakinum TaxID=629680 RepID=A0A1H1NK59_BRESA|nr:radical SAM protein [Brevibacterium sandarakinum]SDR99406.1 uncharacterized protein SAMN04489751_0976 [Brevibacterium sandarakinum]
MLTAHQRNLIERVDHPEWVGDSAKNIGENRPSVHRMGDQLFIFHVLAERSLDGDALVYIPASGKIEPLTGAQEQFLLNCQASDSKAFRLLFDDRFVTIPADGWSFPEIPSAPDLTNVRSRTLVLNPTEQCNIRCTYCYYGGAYDGTRLHQNLSPGYEELAAAIDSFLVSDQRVVDSQQAIYFFGGEPLLGFNKMQEVMDLIRSREESLGISFPNLILQVNTNGMLLNERIMNFLVENDIYMNVSIDGPNHDLYRVDRRGKGTHDRVRDKVEWVAQNWPDYFSKRVAIISVLSQPLDTRKMYKYFAAWDVAQRALAWDFDLVLPGGSGSYDEFQSLFDEQDKIWKLFVSAHKMDAAQRDRSLRYHYAFSHGFLHRSFHRALNQSVPDDPAEVSHLLGVQLIPGSEYLVLGANGTYYTSYEFQAETFSAGTADAGVDYRVGLDQLRGFADGVNSSSCSTCWAARMCTITFPEAPFNMQDSDEVITQKAETKVARCRSERENLSKALNSISAIRNRFGEEPLSEHRADWVRQQEEGPSIAGFNQ